MRKEHFLRATSPMALGATLVLCLTIPDMAGAAEKKSSPKPATKASPAAKGAPAGQPSATPAPTPTLAPLGVPTPPPANISAAEKSLRERVAGYWKARTATNLQEAYPFYA